MKNKSTVSLTGTAMFAALTAVGAFIKIPLPYVPFTLQILFVFLAGSLLGSKKGMQSQLVYVSIGLLGLPVFTQGGGIGYFLQPTFGYLIGFILAAYAVGWIIEKISNPKTHHFILANIAGLVIVYAMGVPYLYLACNTWLGIPNGWTHIVMIGFINSIGGDLIISVFSGMLTSKLYGTLSIMRKQNVITD
ncbi:MULTISPECIES: biotin transporter BioY [Bacillus]|uniref:Biotin transporter n=2 Tax=Bacillus TaxID=1386 RepID=A0A0M4G6I9_9BACI|nr:MULTISPECIES: biotin transporter BioY [Bacillus]ALC80490.1 biotin biosynthesis protein BioY [Bacillus gobiensis]MBP1083559.1 biotin transport system substrate-specific component [Bacillus capparidis]MED1094753.1 biotin transporter BioY [Bacillus capparidis]